MAILKHNISRTDPIAVSTHSKAWACGRLLTGIAGSNPDGAWMSVSCESCVKLEVSALGGSLVQKDLTDCGVSECDLETSTIGKRRPIGAVEPWKKRPQINPINL